MELVDRALRRVLEQKIRLGLFEQPYVDPERAVRIVHSKEHQDLALQTAREGIVLLKNDHRLLPLKKTIKSIAIIGPDANDSRNQLGDYSPGKVLQHVVTILEGIKGKVSPTTRLVYVKGCNVLGDDRSTFSKAVEAAKGADVAVVVVGESTSYSGSRGSDGEGQDVASLDLSGLQEDLVKAVVATGTPTVLVLINGRPLSIRWEAEHVPAIMGAWNPGERGGEALADVLFGDYNPSGRLAITIPRSVGQLPAYYNYKPSKAYWVKRDGRTTEATSICRALRSSLLGTVSATPTSSTRICGLTPRRSIQRVARTSGWMWRMPENSLALRPSSSTSMSVSLRYRRRSSSFAASRGLP